MNFEDEDGGGSFDNLQIIIEQADGESGFGLHL